MHTSFNYRVRMDPVCQGGDRRMNKKWGLYDRLIKDIPAELRVTDLTVGYQWTLVKTELGCGVAMTVRQRAGPSREDARVLGKSLRDAAALVKSWNFMEASVGMAAINAWYNLPERLDRLGVLPHGEEERTKANAFSILGEELWGKNVAVVGHFPNLEKQLAPICRMSVLEREPQQGDYPDSACEYILEEQDYVIITGMTFTNKTLPRLLELIRPGAGICLAGPSVPLEAGLADFGVTRLSGFCATDALRTEEAVKCGVKQGIFQYGHMVDYPIA